MEQPEAFPARERTRARPVPSQCSAWQVSPAPLGQPRASGPAARGVRRVAAGGASPVILEPAGVQVACAWPTASGRLSGGFSDQRGHPHPGVCALDGTKLHRGIPRRAPATPRVEGGRSSANARGQAAGTQAPPSSKASGNVVPVRLTLQPRRKHYQRRRRSAGRTAEYRSPVPAGRGGQQEMAKDWLAAYNFQWSRDPKGPVIAEKNKHKQIDLLASMEPGTEGPGSALF